MAVKFKTGPAGRLIKMLVIRSDRHCREWRRVPKLMATHSEVCAEEESHIGNGSVVKRRNFRI